MDDDVAGIDTDLVEARDRDVPLRIARATGDADAVALVLPAMGVPARYYDGLAAGLADSGRPTVVVELPGTGDSPVVVDRDTRIGYQDLLDGEVAAATGFAARRWPDLPRVLVGHSLGGQLSLLFAASHPDDVRAVALPAAGTIHWRAYEGLVAPALLALTQTARLLARVRGVFPGDRLGFGGRQPTRLIDDWGRTALTGRWEPAGATVDHHRNLARLHLPILSLTMAGDTFAPPSAATALSGLAGGDVEHRTVATGETGRGAHFGWLRRPRGVLDELTPWLDGVLAARP